MEISKLVSSIIAKLKIAYPYYFKELNDEEFIGLTGMYQEQLGCYDYEIVMRAINKIIKTSKFMPTIAEILDNCENQVSSYSLEILKRMKDDGYFKYGVCGELDENQQSRNYEKAINFVSRGIIPEWLLEDMIKYGFRANNLLGVKEKGFSELINNETKLLGSVQ